MSIMFIIVLLAVLILPGAAIVSGLRVIRNRFLFTIAFSYAIFAFNLLIFRLLGLPLSLFNVVVFTYVIGAGCFCVYKFFYQSNQRVSFSPWLDRIYFPLGIAVVFSVYHFIAGAYSEIPGDIYYHVEKVGQVISQLGQERLAILPSFLSALKHDIEVWYNLIGWVAVQTDTSQGEMLESATYVSQLLFLIATYQFALRVFANNHDRKLVAGLVTFLVAIHFGVSAFSYLRYYALAPAMLAFLFYFAVILIFLEILQQRKFDSLPSQILLMVFFTAAAVLVHTQEAMYIAIMLNVMILIDSIRRYRELRNEKRNGLLTFSAFDKTSFAVTGLSILGFVACYLIAHYKLVHFGDIGGRLLEFGPAIGILPTLSILNPEYQFIQVVTLWGVWVYVLFFLHWQRYRENVYVLSGMLLPLFTVFNPLFTDLFLRLVDSTVLWRFCFLIPIHYVAADLVCFYVKRLIKPSKSVKQGIFSCVALLGLCVLLVPYFNGWQGKHYSRYPTLKPVMEKQSYQHLNDVISFLNTLPDSKYMLTDPVTGYVLSGFTMHHSDRDKFTINQYSGFKQFTFSDYSNQPLKPFKDHLLVINKRTIANGPSFMGALARHWPADLFARISYFYPDNLLQHLAQNPQRFKLLYQHDDVYVYAL